MSEAKLLEEQHSREPSNQSSRGRASSSEGISLSQLPTSVSKTSSHTVILSEMMGHGPRTNQHNSGSSGTREAKIQVDGDSDEDQEMVVSAAPVTGMKCTTELLRIRNILHKASISIAQDLLSKLSTAEDDQDALISVLEILRDARPSLLNKVNFERIMQSFDKVDDIRTVLYYFGEIDCNDEKKGSGSLEKLLTQINLDKVFDKMLSVDSNAFAMTLRYMWDARILNQPRYKLLFAISDPKSADSLFRGIRELGDERMFNLNVFDMLHRNLQHAYGLGRGLAHLRKAGILSTTQKTFCNKFQGLSMDQADALGNAVAFLCYTCLLDIPNLTVLLLQAPNFPRVCGWLSQLCSPPDEDGIGGEEEDEEEEETEKTDILDQEIFSFLITRPEQAENLALALGYLKVEGSPLKKEKHKALFDCRPKYLQDLVSALHILSETLKNKVSSDVLDKGLLRLMDPKHTKDLCQGISILHRAKQSEKGLMILLNYPDPGRLVSALGKAEKNEKLLRHGFTHVLRKMQIQEDTGSFRKRLTGERSSFSSNNFKCPPSLAPPPPLHSDDQVSLGVRPGDL